MSEASPTVRKPVDQSVVRAPPNGFSYTTKQVSHAIYLPSRLSSTAEHRRVDLSSSSEWTEANTPSLASENKGLPAGVSEFGATEKATNPNISLKNGMTSSQNGTISPTSGFVAPAATIIPVDNVIRSIQPTFTPSHENLAPTTVPPLVVVQPTFQTMTPSPIPNQLGVTNSPSLNRSAVALSVRFEERSLRIPEPKIARRVGKNGKLGIQLKMQEIFNRLSAESDGRDYTDDYHSAPISVQIVRDCLSFIRFNLYIVMKLEKQKGKPTYSKVRKVYGKSIEDQKGKLESRHTVLKTAVASWACEVLIKEALKRDRVYEGSRSRNSIETNDVPCGPSPNINYDTADQSTGPSHEEISPNQYSESFHDIRAETQQKNRQRYSTPPKTVHSAGSTSEGIVNNSDLSDNDVDGENSSSGREFHSSARLRHSSTYRGATSRNKRKRRQREREVSEKRPGKTLRRKYARIAPASSLNVRKVHEKANRPAYRLKTLPDISSPSKFGSDSGDSIDDENDDLGAEIEEYRRCAQDHRGSKKRRRK